MYFDLVHPVCIFRIGWIHKIIVSYVFKQMVFAQKLVLKYFEYGITFFCAYWKLKLKAFWKLLLCVKYYYYVVGRKLMNLLVLINTLCKYSTNVWNTLTVMNTARHNLEKVLQSRRGENCQRHTFGKYYDVPNFPVVSVMRSSLLNQMTQMVMVIKFSFVVVHKMKMKRNTSKMHQEKILRNNMSSSRLYQWKTLKHGCFST